MDSSERHLESALSEYDGKISVLRDMGASEEYLEALVNRSCILIMLESYDGAIADLKDAMVTADRLAESGEQVNVGTYVKMYENHGLIMYDRDENVMRGDYAKIAPRLKEMKAGVRHYDRMGQISMCVDCAMDLLDFKFYDDCIPFLERGKDLLDGENDVWSRNRADDLYDMYGQVCAGKGDHRGATEFYTKSVDIGKRLYESSVCDDPVGVANTLIRRGDSYGKMKMAEEKCRDYAEAIGILENLYGENRFTDKELLATLHKEFASYLMENGRIEDAEKHLIRSMKLGIPEMGATIEKMKDYT